MPAGVGYGAMAFNALRKGYGAAGRGLGRAAVPTVSGGTKAGSKVGGFLGSLGGRGIGLAGRGAEAVSQMGNAGIMATTGGIAGGLYGAASDDTSVLGGALRGAVLGGGGYGAARLGMRGASQYKMMRGAGLGVGRSASWGLKMMGQMSSQFIGNTSRRAYNGIRGMAGSAYGRASRAARSPFQRGA